jgi:hypothetical protein
MLLTIIPSERSKIVREQPTTYDLASPSLLDDIPLP